jgi:tRNA (cmo5U34)-methyltransferase
VNLPGQGAWSFETSEVADGFDEHVREQLPWYDIATKATVHLAEHYIGNGGLVYDIGASTGNVGKALAPAIERRNAKLVALEPSRAMCAMYKGPGQIINASAFGFHFEPFDVAVCLLSLLFMRPNERARVLRDLRSAANPGGCIIIIDKLEIPGGYVSTAMWRLALAMKLEAGAQPADVLKKELSLIGVQRPLRSEELGDEASEFFRFGQFAGWIIET